MCGRPDDQSAYGTVARAPGEPAKKNLDEGGKTCLLCGKCCKAIVYNPPGVLQKSPPQGKSYQ